MEFQVWLFFLIAVVILYLISYIVKSIFFSIIATLFLIIISLFALGLGLETQSGYTSVVDGLEETITYTYSEIEFGDIKLSNVVGPIGLLVGLYFMGSHMMKLMR